MQTIVTKDASTETGLAAVRFTVTKVEPLPGGGGCEVSLRSERDGEFGTLNFIVPTDSWVTSGGLVGLAVVPLGECVAVETPAKAPAKASKGA